MACGILANKPGAPTKAIRVRNISPNKTPEHGTHGTRGTPCPMSIGTHRKPILTQGLWEGYGSNGGGIVEFPLTKDWSFQRWVPGGRVLWESFFMSTWDSWRLVEGSRGFSLTAWNLETPQLNSIERPWHFMSDFDSDTESLIGLVDSRLVGFWADFRHSLQKKTKQIQDQPLPASFPTILGTTIHNSITVFLLGASGPMLFSQATCMKIRGRMKILHFKEEFASVISSGDLEGICTYFQNFVVLAGAANDGQISMDWLPFLPHTRFFCKTMLGRIGSQDLDAWLITMAIVVVP